MTFALTKLFDDVTAQFAADGVSVVNVFGWRERAKQIETGARIAWAPGDDGDLGEYAPPRGPGGNPRKLGTLLELCTVEIIASDENQPENEHAQYVACREVYDSWARAVYLNAHGTFEIQSQEWMKNQLERRNGAGIRIVFAIQAPTFDLPNSTVPTGAKAAITTSIPTDPTEIVNVPGET